MSPLEKKNDRAAPRLVALCCLVYFAGYMTRLDYAAVLVEIVQDMHIAKTTAGIAVTGSFITYGVGMLIFGVAGDRIAPRRLIFVGLLGTTAINLAVGVLTDIRAVIAVWCFNGFFQAMLWPPITRILAENLSEDAARGAIAKVVLAGQIATVGIYLCAPVLIGAGSWRTVFLVAGALAAVVAGLWLAGTGRIRQGAARAAVKSGGEGVSVWHLVRAAGLIPMMAAIVLMGMLRDGLQTWMPTYICEVFGVAGERAILISSLLPLLSIVGVTASVAVFDRVKDEVTCGGAFFGVSLAAAVVILAIFPGPPLVGVVLFALLAACQYGVNQMLVCFTPTRFEPYGRVATFSGLLNSFVYVGAAASTYGFAGFSEAFGWRSTTALWAAIALAGAVLCAVCLRKWKMFCAGGAVSEVQANDTL